MSSHCSHLAVDDRVVFFWGGGGLVFLVLFKIYLGFGPTAYWPCNLITLIGKTYFYCVQWYWPFWKRMGGFWRRIRKINIDIWIWNQVCASEKLRTTKETFLSQNSIVLLYKTWWFDIFIIKTFRYVTLISFSFFLVSIPNGNFELCALWKTHIENHRGIFLCLFRVWFEIGADWKSQALLKHSK